MTGLKPTLSIGQAFVTGVISMFVVCQLTGEIWNSLHFSTGDERFAYGFGIAAFMATAVIDILFLSWQPPTPLNRSACASIRVLTFFLAFYGCTASFHMQGNPRESVLAAAQVSGIVLGAIYALLVGAI